MVKRHVPDSRVLNEKYRRSNHVSGEERLPGVPLTSNFFQRRRKACGAVKLRKQAARRKRCRSALWEECDGLSSRRREIEKLRNKINLHPATRTNIFLGPGNFISPPPASRGARVIPVYTSRGQRGASVNPCASNRPARNPFLYFSPCNFLRPRGNLIKFLDISSVFEHSTIDFCAGHGENTNTS